ncbi:MAG: transglycosylase domain-containing protein [Clostridia bacterium]
MKKLFKIVLIIILVLVISGAIIGIIVYKSATAKTNLNVELLPTNSSTSIFLDKNSEKIESFDLSFVSPDEIPDNLKHAFIALEDKRFYKHSGIDYIRIIGALKSNIKSGDYVEGGSTISQQLIKNTHLSNAKTIDRKLKEIKLATQLEKNYSKNEILAMYLNVVYFGNGIYGVNAASRAYFNKEIESLTIGECATLVSVLKNPSKYSPLANIENATSRRNLVLKLMFEQGYITEAERDAELVVPIILNPTTNAETHNKSYLISTIYEAAKILNISPQTLLINGYTIKTYYDNSTQQSLFDVISNKEYYAQNSKSKQLEGISMVVDNESCGVTGYYSTIKRQVFEFKRPIGSTVKPILVYAPAFELNLITGATPILDEKTNFNGYIPENYNSEYLGWIDVRTAIKKSSNVSAVKTFNAVGFDKISNFANKLEINLSENDNNLTLALGNFSNGLNFIDLLGGYTMLANGGEYKKPTFIESITDKNGNLIFYNSGLRTRVISKDNCYILTDILMETAKSGTARGLSGCNFEIASKTGTVGGKSSNTDAYNLAYTTKNTMLVWHGNSSGKSDFDMPLSETGGAYITLSMKNILNKLYQNDIPKPFEMPENISHMQIDKYAQLKKQELLLASINTPIEYISTELFTNRNYPTETSKYFEDFTVEGVNVLVNNNNIAEIRFCGADYLNYEISRFDGRELKKIIDISKNTGKFEYFDDSVPYNTYVEYYIKPYFYNQFNEKIEGKTAISDIIFIKNDFNYFDNIDDDNEFDKLFE